MHGSRIPIWFFIGLLLTVYGVMIFAYGLYEAATGNYPPGVQLTELHTPIWWGRTWWPPIPARGCTVITRFCR